MNIQLIKQCKDRKDTRKIHKYRWKKIIGKVAVIALVFGLGFYLVRLFKSNDNNPVVLNLESTPEQTDVPEAQENVMPAESELVNMVIRLEQGVQNFVFQDPSELDADQLFQAYLILESPEEWKQKFDEVQQAYMFTQDDIEKVLLPYFKNLTLDIRKATNYDPELNAIVVSTPPFFGGDLIGKIKDSMMYENIVQFTVSYYSESFTDGAMPGALDFEYEKNYIVEIYPNGYYYLAATFEEDVD